MRRYTINISGREFAVDVQERSADRFDVVVDGQNFSVVLSGEQDGASADINGTDDTAAPPPLPPRAAPAPVAAPVRAAARAPSAPGSLHAPMPGVILELFVQPGDVVKRGQQVAVLDAMKMHNFIGAPRDGTVSEVCVSAGQAVGHGDTILRFAA